MKVFKLVILFALLLSLTACITPEEHRKQAQEYYKNKTKYTVTVNFGNKIRVYRNVVSINVPERFRVTTILHFDDGTQLEIVGGTIWWSDHIPHY